MIKVRSLEIQDHDEWQKLFTDYASFREPAPPQEQLDEVWRLLIDEDSTATGLLAVDLNDQPIGFVHYMTMPCTTTAKSTCYMQDIFVMPEHRRKGVAQTMIHALYAIAGEKQYRNVYWKTMSDNKDAQELYDKIATKSD